MHEVSTIFRATTGRYRTRRAMAATVRTAWYDNEPGNLPVLLTVGEAAQLLRTSRRAIYAMVERRQLPGVIRIRRRVLVRTAVLLDWLDQKRAPSPEE